MFLMFLTLEFCRSMKFLVFEVVESARRLRFLMFFTLEFGRSVKFLVFEVVEYARSVRFLLFLTLEFGGSGFWRFNLSILIRRVGLWMHEL